MRVQPDDDEPFKIKAKSGAEIETFLLWLWNRMEQFRMLHSPVSSFAKLCKLNKAN